MSSRNFNWRWNYQDLFREIFKVDVHEDFLFLKNLLLNFQLQEKAFENSKLRFKNPAFKDIFKNLPYEILYDTKLGKLNLFKKSFIESKINDQNNYDKSHFDTIL